MKSIVVLPAPKALATLQSASWKPLMH